MQGRVQKAVNCSGMILRKYGERRYYRGRVFQILCKKMYVMSQVTRNRYKSSAWPSENKKAPEFNPVSSKVWISIISEFWIDEILCKLYVQEMHMLFLPANQSFYKTSTSKITLNCIFTASLRPTRNPCKKNALT